MCVHIPFSSLSLISTECYWSKIWRSTVCFLRFFSNRTLGVNTKFVKLKIRMLSGPSTIHCSRLFSAILILHGRMAILKLLLARRKEHFVIYALLCVHYPTLVLYHSTYCILFVFVPFSQKKMVPSIKWCKIKSRQKKSYLFSTTTIILKMKGSFNFLERLFVKYIYSGHIYTVKLRL